MYIF
jgi:predicted nucleic acid-binding protein/antitoxin component of MazEF toxin-antitoxin module